MLGDAKGAGRYQRWWGITRMPGDIVAAGECWGVGLLCETWMPLKNPGGQETDLTSAFYLCVPSFIVGAADFLVYILLNR
jgi:hypothetical protein